MKTAITIRTIKNSYRKVFRAGYCDLWHIMYTTEPQFYNHGIYGWNCDIYVDYKRDIAITTGYRNMTGMEIPVELITKYTEIAKAIIANECRASYEEVREALNVNMESFWNELDKI